MGGLPHPDGKSRELVTVFSLGRVLQKNIGPGTDGVREVTGGSSPPGEEERWTQCQLHFDGSLQHRRLPIVVNYQADRQQKAPRRAPCVLCADAGNVLLAVPIPVVG